MAEVRHLAARNDFDAWDIVKDVFPTDWEKDEESSQRAGYPIYRSTVNISETDYYNYICDLDDALEVNLTDKNWKSRTIIIHINRIDVDKIREELRKITAELYPSTRREEK